jgi:stress response protein YsnF
VSKQARVKEEVVVKKDVDQRTETVSDTVRRTEVKVEDERGDAGSKTRKPI